MMEELSPQEREAMLALWKIQKGTARQVLEAHDEPLPHYNTLRSTLDNLRQKKYLEIRAVGTTNEYIPVVKEGIYKKKRLSEFVNDHFGNSYKELVTFFALEKNLSEEDLKEIIDIIKTKRKK